MRTSLQLSAPSTFVHKWIFPAFPLLALPFLVQNALRGHSGEWIGVVFCSVACAAVLIWSWPIKLVTIEGDYFVISNYFTSHRVPVANLASIIEIPHRTPAIMLKFEPPTPFGRRVRIIPPCGFFIINWKDFDEVVTFLRSMANDRERL